MGENFKQTAKYREAVEASVKREADSQRLVSQIYHAQKEYSLGRAMAFQVRRGVLTLVDPQTDVVSDARNLRLVEAFESNERCKSAS